MMTAARLTNSEIVIMRSLFKRGGGATPISLLSWMQRFALNLWRRGLIEIWYRQSIDAGLVGPFCTLTLHGARMAQSFFRPTIRQLSAAEKQS